MRNFGGILGEFGGNFGNSGNFWGRFQEKFWESGEDFGNSCGNSKHFPTNPNPGKENSQNSSPNSLFFFPRIPKIPTLIPIFFYSHRFGLATIPTKGEEGEQGMGIPGILEISGILGFPGITDFPFPTFLGTEILGLSQIWDSSSPKKSRIGIFLEFLGWIWGWNFGMFPNSHFWGEIWEFWTIPDGNFSFFPQGSQQTPNPR